MPELSQLDKFKALAEEAECDTNEKKFDRSLKQVAKSAPQKKSETTEEHKQNI